MSGLAGLARIRLLDADAAIGDDRAEGGEADRPLRGVNVDPGHRRARPRIPQALTRRLATAECGIYAEVIAGGTIGVGDTIAADQLELL